MMLLVSAGNMVTVYLGLELLTLSQYALVALNRDSAASSEAAIKYFVLGALASGLLLYGMSMIYGATGTLDLAKIHVVVGDMVHSEHRTLLAFGLVFLITGIAFKFGAAPFHMWIPDVYEGAPTAMVVFVGSAPKLAAFGMAYRLLEGAMAGMHADWTLMLSMLAVLSLAIGNMFAIAQTNLKRLLGYSTISHIGFLLLGFVNGTPSGFAAALFYAISYALMATVAFGVILLLARAGFEAEQIDDFKGLNQRNPWYAGVMAIAMFSLAGVPPLFGFFAKLMVLKAVIDAGIRCGSRSSRLFSRSSASITTCAWSRSCTSTSRPTTRRSNCRRISRSAGRSRSTASRCSCSASSGDRCSTGARARSRAETCRPEFCCVPRKWIMPAPDARRRRSPGTS